MVTEQELKHQITLREIQLASEAQKLTSQFVGRLEGDQRTALIEILKTGNQYTDPVTNKTYGNQFFTPQEAAAFVDRYELIQIQQNDGYGYAATAWKDRDTGAIYVGVRSTENRLESRDGDYTRDSLADKQILTTGFAWGQTVSHVEFLQKLALVSGGAPVYQSAYSLSGNLVSNAILAGYDLGTTSGHLAVNATGAGYVGSGTTQEALDAYQRLRNPIGLTQSELDTIRTTLPEGDIRRITFEQTYQDALDAEFAGNGSLYWQQPIGTDYARVYDDPREQLAVMATQILYQTTFSKREDASLSGITYLYGHATTVFDTQLVANSGMHGPKLGIWIPGQPQIVAGEGVFSGFYNGMNGTATANSDFALTHSAILVDQSLKLFYELKRLDANLSIEDFNLLMQNSSNTRASLIAPDGNAIFSEHDTLSLAVNNLGNLLGLPDMLDMGVTSAWDTGFRADYSLALSQINSRITDILSIDPNAHLMLLVPDLALHTGDLGASETEFYSEIRLWAGQDSLEGNAVRQALASGSPIALVSSSLDHTEYSLGRYSASQLNTLASDYVDSMFDNQGNLSNGVANTRWTATTTSGGFVSVVETDSNDAVSAEYDVNGNLVNIVELDGDNNVLSRTINNADGSQDTEIYDFFSGSLLGQTQTLSSDVLFSQTTLDIYASLLDGMRDASLADSQALLNASEIFTLTGTQATGAAWGGTDWLEFSGGALGEYWDITRDADYTGDYYTFDGSVDYSLPWQGASLGSNNSLLSYSGLGFQSAFSLAGGSGGMINFGYGAAGNSTTTSLTLDRWGYSPSWNTVSTTPLSTTATTVNFDYLLHTDDWRLTTGENDGLGNYSYEWTLGSGSSSNMFYYTSSSSSGGYWWLPVALDLDGDGVELMNKEDSRAYFDVKGDGFRNKVGWIGADDGFLAIDKNADGKIDQADELSFALWTANPDDTDLEALKTVFDTNLDGKLDAADAQWSQLRVWQDANGDGVTDVGELKTLAQAGMASLNLTAAKTDWASGGNHITGFTTWQKTDGSNGWAADVGLGYEADGWNVSVQGSLVRATQSGGLVYGLTSGAALNLDLGVKGLDGAIGGAGADTLMAGAQIGALLSGGAGNDTLTGGTGDDWLSGGAGSDTLMGGAGDDTLLIDAQDLQANINGGDGFDIAVVTGSQGVMLDLFHTKLEAAIGGDGDDRFYTTGTARAVLAGQGGNDILKSGAGHDILQGGTGNDTLYGGYGTDIAVYTGYQKDYELAANANGSLTVRDINLSNGDDGVDTLHGIQTIRFVDGDINLAPSNTGQGEVRVNTTTTRDQFYPSVAALTDGGFVVTWMDDTPSPTNANIYAQRYGAGGNAVGAEFLVNTYATNQQEIPSVTGLANGGYVIVWRSYGQDGSGRGIYGQRYGADNTKTGAEFRINTYTTDQQDDPTVISLADGGFLVTWQSNGQDGSGYGVYAQRYASNGSAAGAEFRVNTTTSNHQNNPEVTMLTDGGFVVTWSSGATPSTSNIYAQRFDSAGNKVSGEIKVNTTVYGAESSVTALADGGYVVAWLAIVSGSQWHVFGQRYAANGTAIGGELMLSTSSTGSSSSGYNSLQVAPVVTALLDGSYVATWTVYSASGADIYMRRAMDGNAIGDAVRVNTTTANNQSTPAVTAMPDGGFVVTWTSVGQDGSGSEAIYAQRYDADGRPWTSAQTITGSQNADHLSAAASQNAVILVGQAGNDLLQGGQAIDTLIGGLGDDTYVLDNTSDVITENAGEGTDTVQSSVSWTLGANLENLTLTASANINATGNSANNALTGNSGNNTLYGLDGNDTLEGGTGSDTLIGGTGNDTYVVDTSADVVTENAGEGTDTVQSAVSWTLGANLENLTLTGFANIDATGNSANNFLTGNSGNNTLNGGGGTDTMLGGGGDDTYIVDDVTDVVTENAGEGTDTVQSVVSWTLGANLENLTLTGTSNINATGNSGNNTLTGSSGNNTLNGGGGTDTMLGGSGNDTYVVDDATDVVTENAGEGTDTIQSSISWTLGANLENLTLTGSANIDATGNSANNFLTGNSGNNTINGGGGTDTMLGGSGNDTYVVDDATDVVTENAGEGTDTVQSSISWALGANLENLTLTGSANNDATGNSANNILTGNSGNNTLNGGGGTDTMLGGSGNDTYIVDDTTDVVTENAAEGTDTIQSSISWTLGANLENLTLTGTSNINATGNTLNNTLIGNSAANVLSGGLGDDTYFVSTGDTVVENANEGIDLIASTVTYTLGAYVEYLVLDGVNDINGTGNVLNNILIGNIGDNVLDGGAGNDIMAGLTGNDIYVVESTWDAISESSTEATEIDTVLSSITYILGANLENLTLTGTTSICGTGNGGDNTLVGNTASNMLSGGTGNDILVGGATTSTTPSPISSLVVYARGTPVEGGYPIMQVFVGGVMVQQFTVDATSYTAYTVNPASLGMSSDKVDIVFTNDAYHPDQGQDRNLCVQKIVVNGQAWNATDNGVFYDLGSGAAAFDGVNTRLQGETVYSNGALRFTLADNDTLDGGTGADAMSGGTGNDTYVVDDPGDVVNEAENAGTDLVRSSIGHVLGANVEHLVLTGSAAINGTGNALDNLLMGNAGNNVLTGGAGNDTLLGGAGDDTLDGGGGSDAMQGDQGNDLYIVDTSGKSLWERANEGVDTVRSSVNFTLPTDFENLILTGTASISGTGNGGNNTITGNDANNTLSGGAGNDTLLGGVGNDWLEGGAGADIIDGGAGTDDYASYSGSDQAVNVNLSLSQASGGHAQGDTLIGIESLRGSNYDDVLVGTSANNSLNGGSGNDTLDGAAGNDWMEGGAGADVINGGEGTSDSAAYSGSDLAVNVNLLLGQAGGGHAQGDVLSGIENLRGSNFNDVLVGDAVNNSINGGAGNDVIEGGAGNDWLEGNAGADSINGGDGAGDWVTYGGSDQAVNINLVLNQLSGGHAHGDTLSGVEGLWGSNYDDVLIGDAGNNRFQGYGGNDFIDGGAGIDAVDFYSAPVGATVDLVAGTAIGGYAGTDTLLGIENISGSNVGNDFLFGDAGVNSISGNGGNDSLFGWGGNDWMDGGAGNDTLSGGAGNDTLLGQAGNDTYLFSRGDGTDTWTDSDPTAGNLDIARFGSDIAHDQIWFRRVGYDLETSVIGTTDKAVVKYWYVSSANHIERFESGNGKILLDSQVDALVSAMAAFSPPPPGPTSLPPAIQQALAPVLAANWQ